MIIANSTNSPNLTDTPFPTLTISQPNSLKCQSFKKWTLLTLEEPLWQPHLVYTNDYTYMTFGLWNATANLQRHLDNIIMDYVFIYVDEISLLKRWRPMQIWPFQSSTAPARQFLNNTSIHQQIRILSKLIELYRIHIKQRWNSTINKQAEYHQGFPRTKPHKISVIHPRISRLLPLSQSKFFIHCPTITELTRLNQRNKCLTLSNKERAAYNKIKETLSAATVLPHPIPSVTQVHLVTDSSQYAIGAALH